MSAKHGNQAYLNIHKAGRTTGMRQYPSQIIARYLAATHKSIATEILFLIRAKPYEILLFDIEAEY